MKLQDRYNIILDRFRHRMPNSSTELHYANEYQLLVSVILSAQCTDKRVNLVTPALFTAYPSVLDMSKAEASDILPYISSVSYPNSKAAYLAASARMIVNEYGGSVPDSREMLIRLPGVGRKTANVIQSVAFGHATLAVDTHVYRVSHRIPLVPSSANTPLKVETALTRHIPEADIPRAHHWLLLHGRYICQARRPKCDVCFLNDICSYNYKNRKKLK